MNSDNRMLDRLEEIAKSMFGSISAMAVDMGKSPSYFSSYKSQGKELGGRTLIAIRDKYSINSKYLISGERPVFLKKNRFTEDGDSYAVDNSQMKPYSVLIKEEVDSEEWKNLIDKYEFKKSISKIYKVETGLENMYYTSKQFKELFRLV